MKLEQLFEGEPRDEQLANDYIELARHGLSGTSARIDKGQIRIYQDTDESDDGLEEPDKYYIAKSEVWPDTWQKLVAALTKAGVVE